MRGGWPAYYILVGKTPVAVDMLTWVRAMEDRFKSCSRSTRRGKKEFQDPWSVADTYMGKVRVSTVFLGLDHNWLRVGEPLLFETLIFGGPLDGNMRRYSTWAEAARGHAEMEADAEKAAASIDAIKKAAGADR